MTVACVATVLFDRSSGLRVDGLGGDVYLKTVNVDQVDGLRIHSSTGMNSARSQIFGTRKALLVASLAMKHRTATGGGTECLKVGN